MRGNKIRYEDQVSSFSGMCGKHGISPLLYQIIFVLVSLIWCQMFIFHMLSQIQ